MDIYLICNLFCSSPVNVYCFRDMNGQYFPNILYITEKWRAFNDYFSFCEQEMFI